MSWKSSGRISSSVRGQPVAEGRRRAPRTPRPARDRAARGCGRARGAPAFESRSATASLAASMNSSIARMLSRRAVATMPGHLARRVQHELGLGQVEVERAALVAALAHQLGELVHALEERHERREAAARSSASPSTMRLDLLVRHARGALDHAVVELGPADLALGVELEHARSGSGGPGRRRGCRCRWRGRAAASAPRGPGNRPTCRGGRPPGRAGDPRRT